MKYLFFAICMLSFNSYGQVQAPSEDLLEGDLSFKLTEEKQEETRGVASEKSSEEENLKGEKTPEKSKKLEYWKY